MRISTEARKFSKKSSSRVSVINGELLRAGDILLTTQITSAVSSVIRTVTRSNFSHAAIIMERSQCIEAVGDGVRVVCLDRVCFFDRTNMRLLRLMDSSKGHVAEKAAALARGHLFRPYWIEGAMSAPIRSRGNTVESQRFFCSHLVAHCYREAGLALFNDRESEKVVPGDFLSSPLLEDITDGVINEVAQDDAPSYALDLGEYPESGESLFVDLNMRITRDLRDGLRAEWFGPFRNDLHQFTHWFVFFFIDIHEDCKREYDSVLYCALMRHRFLDFIPHDIPRLNPATYIEIGEWGRLLVTAELSLDGLRGQKGRLEVVLRAVDASRSVYEKDLAHAQRLWDSYPKIDQFKAATLLFRFYRQRVSAIQEDSSVLRSKIKLLDKEIGSRS